MIDELWLTLFAVVLAGGQLLFKVAATGLRGVAGPKLLLAMATSPALWVALAFYGGATVLWVWLLTRVPLSRAYPFSALGLVLVPLAANLLFGERLRPVFWLGAALIVAGILIIQWGVGEPPTPAPPAP